MLRADFTRKALFSKLIFLLSARVTMASATGTNKAIFSVSRLNTEVRQLLEQGFGQIWLVGEISNFAAPASGHWYFTLKDERAQVKAAMFRGANQRARIRPQNGMQVMVRAKITLYEPRGDYQLIAEHIEDAGAGLLQQQFEQLKADLAARGLFAPEHKLPLPEKVTRVGIITSPTGAAVRDILAVLKRRDPSLEVIIYPSSVQGQAATQELQNMLKTAVQRNEVEVLIISRGGGSLEDLWCFNDPGLAQLIYDCPIPIISAVGHEVDFTIADFVADVRAPTPSAAAEMVSRDQAHQLVRAQQLEQRATRTLTMLLQGLQQQSTHQQQRLQHQHPQRRLQDYAQRVDELSERQLRAVQGRLQQANTRLEHLQQRLDQQHPARALKQHQQTLTDLRWRQGEAVRRLLQQHQQKLSQSAHALQLISPLNTVARGYALVQTEHGELVRSETQLKTGETFAVKVASGEFKAQKL